MQTRHVSVAGCAEERATADCVAAEYPSLVRQRLAQPRGEELVESPVVAMDQEASQDPSAAPKNAGHPGEGPL